MPDSVIARCIDIRRYQPQSDYAQSIQQILAARVPVDQENMGGTTALMKEARGTHEGSTTCVQLLLNAKASPTKKDDLGNTALAHALDSRSSHKTLELLSAHPSTRLIVHETDYLYKALVLYSKRNIYTPSSVSLSLEESIINLVRAGAPISSEHEKSISHHHISYVLRWNFWLKTCLHQTLKEALTSKKIHQCIYEYALITLRRLTIS